MTRNHLDKYAAPVLRFGLVMLFLWFGLSQIISPGDWVAWVPEWASALMPAHTIILLNGAFETILGLALAAGFYTRIAALDASVAFLPFGDLRNHRVRRIGIEFGAVRALQADHMARVLDHRRL